METQENYEVHPLASLEKELEEFSKNENIRGKGPLAVMLVVNEQVKRMRFPIDSDLLLTQQGGQVLGLGKSAVQAILSRHKIDRVLAEEGGRTSRGSIKNMRSYVEFLNAQHALYGSVDLAATETFWIDKVRAFFSGKPLVMKLDPSWGIRKAIRHITDQALKRQQEARGSMFLGTMMQHLVGAKLEVALQGVQITHHNSNQSDGSEDRHGDFDINGAAIHVTTAPAEALIRKCGENLGKGKRPIIVTTRKGMLTAEGLLENAGIYDRVDLIEFEQFIATNVLELGAFSPNQQKLTLQSIVESYNNIISRHETDHSLKIEITAGK